MTKIIGKKKSSKEVTTNIPIPPPIFQTLREISDWEEISINAIISCAMERYVVENSFSSLNLDEAFGKGMEEIVRNMISSDFSTENISKFTSIPEETIKSLINKQSQNQPNLKNWAVRDCKKICVMIREDLQKEIKRIAKQKNVLLKDLVAQVLFDYINNLEIRKKLTETQVEVVQKMISANMDINAIVKHTKVPEILIKELGAKNFS